MTDMTKHSNRRILVIDDSEAIHQDFRKILTPDSQSVTALAATEAALFGETADGGPQMSYHVDSALQGQEGLDRVQQALREDKPYALAFVDVRMPPGWDGIETVQRIWEICPDLQIVICTAYSDHSWNELQAKLNPLDRLLILKKPFDAVEVLQLANAQTEKWRLLQLARLRLGDLEERGAALTRELTAAAAEWQGTFDAMDAYVAIIDSDCRVVRANRAMLDAFQGQSVIGANCFRLVHGTECRPDTCVSRKTFETGAIMHAEVREPHLGNRWFDVSAFPIRQPDGAVTKIVHILRDINERKTAEEAKAALEDELHRQQKIAAVGTLACGMGHEINNPLMGVMGYAQLITARLKGKDDALAEFAGEILIGAERIASIVRGLTVFASRDMAPRVPTAVSDLVEAAVTATRDPLRQDAITLEVDLPDGLPTIACDCAQMEQVVTSLIGNARDALNEKYPERDDDKRIMISARLTSGSETRSSESGSAGVRNPQSAADRRETGTPKVGSEASIRITIEDHGTGIPPDMRERIFEPFYTTKDRSVGAGSIGKGLGLFVGYAVVKEHGGGISVESEIGQWTRFHVDLPISDKGYRISE